MGRGAWGGRTVARWTLVANQVSRVRDGGWPLPLSALIWGQNAPKRGRNGDFRGKRLRDRLWRKLFIIMQLRPINVNECQETNSHNSH